MHGLWKKKKKNSNFIHRDLLHNTKKTSNTFIYFCFFLSIVVKDTSYIKSNDMHFIDLHHKKKKTSSDTFVSCEIKSSVEALSQKKKIPTPFVFVKSIESQRR